jgi:PRTRC genetic system ThiF family protein
MVGGAGGCALCRTRTSRMARRKRAYALPVCPLALPHTGGGMTYLQDTSRRGQVRLPAADQLWVYLVGTGGTGSHLALALARLVWHARTRGIQVHLTLVDPDRVEAKNVGRQLFCPAEVGQNKAETLALRFNAAFGLSIRAVSRPVADLTLERKRSDQLLVLGAVDNHPARQDIHKLVTYYHAWWCDAGNEAVAGRVYIGNLDAGQMKQMGGLDAFGWCRALPLPGVHDPGLLQPPPESASSPDLSCADLTALDAQSLMVNQLIATVAAQYATDFVLHRRLKTYRTVVSLDPPTVVSAPITVMALANFGIRSESVS